jgi:hypothetical protein
MIDVEPLILSGLEKLLPVPSGERADWHDVLQRAGIRADRRRRAALLLSGLAAAVLVAVATPVGPAIAKGIGDFSAWLTGHPGKQAPASEQRAFDATNGHSWASFPKGTELRELIRARVGGRLYILSGFRSGNSLCLRLSGNTRRTKTGPACAPASTLAHVSVPILVVTANRGFTDQYSHETAQFSFGIVADGVKQVDVTATDGPQHRAFLGGNTYLWIESEPNTGNRVKSISATSASGRTSTVSFPPRQVVPFQLESPTAKPGGPTRLEATIHHPTIGWAVRHEKRGLTPEQAKLTPEQLRSIGSSFTDVRLFKPDPLSNLVVGLTYDGCIVAVGGGGGCGALADFFSRGPINFMTFGGGPYSSDQFQGIAGAAADGVDQVRIYLPDGEQQSAPLRDNMFAALVPARFPIKVVAYDSRHRVVGIQTFPPSSFAAHFATPTTAKGTLRPVLNVTGPNGVKATVSVGRVVNRQQCWRAAFSTGQSESGCELTFYTGGKIRVDLLQPAGRDLFVIGGVDGRVTDHVELHFDNGDVITTHPVADRYAFAVPRTHLRTERHFGYVLAVDRRGHRVQRQGIAFRANP